MTDDEIEIAWLLWWSELTDDQRQQVWEVADEWKTRSRS